MSASSTLAASFVFFACIWLPAHAQQSEAPIAGNKNVLPPIVVHDVTPKCPHTGFFHLSHSRSVNVYLIVEPSGEIGKLAIAKSGGAAFDQNALAAVRQYRFRPATLDGKPVKVDLYIAVNFNCY